MGDISRNFSSSEFACSCGCGFMSVSPKLIYDLELIRAYFGGKRITITSGCRCVKHNASIPGAAEISRHLPQDDGDCYAADFMVHGVHEDEVADFIERIFPNSHGLGRYYGRTHLDVRRHRARWDFR
jgi:uncharacterized protein YcbK (DUF882 family)